MVYVGRMPGREKSCWQIKYTRRHYLIRLLMDEDNLIIAQKEYLLDLTLKYDICISIVAVNIAGIGKKSQVSQARFSWCILMYLNKHQIFG
ncbi:MAG: hypothetical protein C0611_10855 [Desulfobacteraceae bacterium]|nr:MAG: hypothetical protein C0611_10855 [Desulfobacteraceae bacterium]